jgi:cobalt-zinc-cadmium efflux system membrane fusion protein
MTEPSPGPPRGRALPRRTQLSLLGVAALVVALLMFGLPALVRLFVPRPAPPAPSSPGQFVATQAQWATLAFAKALPVRFTPSVGTEGKIAVDDDRTTQVFSPYSGRVTRVFATVGDRVRAGQPLFAVDASEVVQGTSDLNTAVAQLKVAAAAEARQHHLYESQGAALKDWQQSQSDLAAASASVAAARARLRILGVIAAETQPPSRSASGGFAGNTIVHAPIAGVVTQRSVGLGQTVASVTSGGSTPAFVVSDLSLLWLVGALREVDSPRARIGAPLDVQVMALPGRQFSAKVSFISPTVDPTSRRVAVRADVENRDGALKPEMFATFVLATGQPADAIGVPSASVIYEGDSARVWVAHGGRSLELRQIRVGPSQGARVAVLSGLQAGETVVTGGALFIDRAAEGG